MTRTKIDQYERYYFKTELTVRVNDLNYGAHLGHDNLLGMAHEARLKMFDKLGVSELDLGDGKTSVVAADLGVVYQGEGFRGDCLVFEINPVEIRGGSFRLAYRVRRKDGAPVALIEIGFVAFDPKHRKATRLPDSFVTKLNSLDGVGESLNKKTN